MALKYKALYPWIGGLDTSQDPITLNPQNLTVADNVSFTLSGSRKKRGGQARYNSSKITGASASSMVYFTSYWSNITNVKREYFVALSDNGKAFRSVPGSGTWSSFSTLSLTVAQGGVTSAVMNEDLIIGLKGSGVPKLWINQSTTANLVAMTTRPATSSSLPFSNAWILCSFIERLFVAGDPAQPDRLYFSHTGDYRDWRTTASPGFASSIDIGIGDGDSSGITAVFPGTGYNRLLYVAKRKRLYAVNVSDSDQSKWTVTLISNQIGVINPNAVITLDESDVVFMSDRGVHSLSQVLQTTAIIPGEFLSYPIQPDYQSVINAATRDKMSLTYVPSLNSILFSCRRIGSTTYETIYGFNIILKQWFRWTSSPCNFIYTRLNASAGTDELYACDVTGFINKLNQTTLSDFGSAIVSTIQSSFIYPEGIPLFEYNFTRVIMIFRSRDNSTFTLQYSIDGLSGSSALIQQRTAGGNTLGTTHLGTAFILGNNQAVKPFYQNVEGTGSALQLTFIHNTISKDFELFGIVIEYEDAGDRQNPYSDAVYG